jgi:outer membrane protein assembly factor BamB
LAADFGGTDAGGAEAIFSRGDVPSVVLERHLFYNDSDFDQTSAFDAIATDKVALRKGEVATFANYSSSTKGINGIIVVVDGFDSVPDLNSVAAFFEFRVGNNETPNFWADAPAVDGLTYLENFNAAGHDQIVLTWPNNAIEKTWLEVKILANDSTGLPQQDAFYFGNAPGETGNDDSNATVNLVDVGLTRINQTGFTSAAIDNVYDFDRDGRVNLVDVALARGNQSGFIRLELIDLAFDNWSNFGGNAQRNGLSTNNGPTDDTLLWENNDDYSVISWHPLVFEDKVFAIREAGFPGTDPNDTLIAYDLNTGSELWREVLPWGGDSDEEWIAYAAGANDGKVYAARGGSGRSTPIYAYDVADGELVWESEYETFGGPYDGIVFAPDGDLIAGDFNNLVRIEGDDGSTVWSTPRLCPVSGNCGAAISEDGVFIDAPVFGGAVIVKYDLSNGDFLYESSTMPGFISQNSPFVSPDGGTVYFAKSNNTTDDFLYAFEDTGSGFVAKWNVPIRYSVGYDHGVAVDGSVYTFLRDDEFVKLDPETGEVTASAGVLSPIGTALSGSTAVTADGNVYVSNGWSSTPATNGRVWAFNEDLSTNLFTLELNRINVGGPSLGQDATLVVADRDSIRAYRSLTPPQDRSAINEPVKPVRFDAGVVPPVENSTGYSLLLQPGSELGGETGLIMSNPRFRFENVVATPWNDSSEVLRRDVLRRPRLDSVIDESFSLAGTRTESSDATAVRVGPIDFKDSFQRQFKDRFAESFSGEFEHEIFEVF